MKKNRGCPFCGGTLKYESRHLNIGEVHTEAVCTRCSMGFSYTQAYVLSRKSRVALNKSFEQIWNERVES